MSETSNSLKEIYFCCHKSSWGYAKRINFGVLSFSVSFSLRVDQFKFFLHLIDFLFPLQSKNPTLRREWRPSWRKLLMDKLCPPLLTLKCTLFSSPPASCKTCRVGDLPVLFSWPRVLFGVLDLSWHMERTWFMSWSFCGLCFRKNSNPKNQINDFKNPVVS